MTSGRLISVIEHLARVHGEETPFQERIEVLQACLFMSLPNDAIRHLMLDLLHYYKLHSGQEEVDAASARFALEAAAAALLLCKHSPPDGQSGLGNILDQILLSVLASADPFLVTQQQDISDCMFALLVAQQRWDLILSLIHSCSLSLVAMEITESSSELSGLIHRSQQVEEEDVKVGGRLPLHTVILLSRGGLQNLSAHLDDLVDSGLQAEADSQLQTFYSAACRGLFGQDDRLQTACCKILIPNLLTCFSAFQAANLLDPRPAYSTLTTTIVSLLKGKESMATGLTLLLQSPTLLISDPSHAAPDFLLPAVKGCLSSPEPASQKRALFILQKSLPETLTSGKSWCTFLLLFNVLDEFAPHLIQAVWDKQMADLVHEVQSDNRELSFDMSWLVILWHKGLRHSNLQVQKLVLDSILQLEWTENGLQALPLDFVIGGLHTQSLLKAVTHPIPAQGYVDWLQQHFGEFIHKYLRHASSERRWMGIKCLIEEASHPGRQRIAMQVLLHSLACAASACGALSTFSTPAQLADRSLLLTSSISGMLDNLECFVGATFQLQQIRGLLSSVTVLLPSGSCPASSITSVLEVLPLRHLQPAGQLHQLCQDWLNPSGSSSRFDSAVKDAFSTFFQPRQPALANLPVADHDLQVWHSAASRLAKMLLFASPESSAIEELFSCMQEKVELLYNRPYLAQRTAERILLLLSAMTEAAMACGWDSAYEGQVSTAPETATWLQTRLQLLFRAVHQDLDSYCKAAWAAFWSPLTMNGETLLATPNVSSSSPEAPRQFGCRSQKLAPHVAAAMTRAKLALSCTALGACHAIGHANEEPIQNTSSEASGAVSPSTQNFLRRWSSGMDFQSGRRRGSLEATSSNSAEDAFNSVVKFLQQCTSTPLPLPSGNASATRAEAYAEVRREALLSLSAALLPLAYSSHQNPSFAKWLTREVKFEKLLTVINELQAKGDSRLLEIARWQAVKAILDITQAGGQTLPASTLSQTFLNVIHQISSTNESALPHILSCQRLLLEQALQAPGLVGDTAKALGVAADAGPAAQLEGVCDRLFQADWAALQDMRKRTVTAICSYLHCVLLPLAFACTSEDDPRWSLHTQKGCMRRLVVLLLEQAKKSLRLMALFALQLVKILTNNPAVLPLYADVYEDLLTTGVWPCDQPEATCQDKVIGGGGDRGVIQEVMGFLDGSEYENYKHTALAGRVAAACGIARLVQLAEDTTHSLSKHAMSAGQCLWNRLFDRACSHHKQHQTKRLPHNLDQQGRLRLRIWQAACCCIQFAPTQDPQPLIAAIFDMLQMELLGTVKAAKEIMLTYLFKQQKALIWTYLLPRLSDYSQNVSRVDSLPSAILVATQLLFDGQPEEQEQLLMPLLAAILPWSMLHHQSIRAYSQVTMQAILQRFPEALGDSASQELRRAASFLKGSPSMKKLDGLKSVALRELSPETARAPTHIFLEGGLPAGREGEVVAREAAPTSLLECVQDFLINERANLRRLTKLDESETLLPVLPHAAKDGKHTDLQRKIQPLQHGMEGLCNTAFHDLFVEALPAEAAAALSKRQEAGKRQPIILVASLLDRIPNLAGLTRTCEVFQAQALVLPDLSLTRQSEFASISVTAEKHMPLLEVKPEGLAAWLLDKKQEGYAILGLEQTSEALPLPNYNFSSKTVIILGREREGIPAELLNILDCALVIPQLGVIRSLNAHVSGSIALYEYTRCFLNLK